MITLCFNCDKDQLGTAGIWDIACDRCRKKLDRILPNEEDFLVRCKIAKVRKSKGVRQEDLAEALGISRAQITQIETNSQTFSITQLYQIAKALGVEATDLMVPNLDNKLLTKGAEECPRSIHCGPCQKCPPRNKKLHCHHECSK